MVVAGMSLDRVLGWIQEWAGVYIEKSETFITSMLK